MRMRSTPVSVSGSSRTGLARLSLVFRCTSACRVSTLLAAAACTNSDNSPTQERTFAVAASVAKIQSNASFAFSADVTILATMSDLPDTTSKVRENGFQSNAATPARVLTQYHLEYTEFGDRVVLDITPPDRYASDPGVASRATRPMPWATLRQIHLDSDSVVGQFTLWSGRAVSGDFRVLTALDPRSGTARETRSGTAVERARAIRSRIRPFLSVREESALKGLGFDERSSDMAAREMATWAQLSSDFDVVVARSLSRRVESGRRPNLSIELRNPRVVGIPSALE